MAREKSIARRERGEMEGVEPWDTFREMERMMRGFFGFPLMRPWWTGQMLAETTPEVDLKETDKDFVLSAALPGMNKDDIDIDVTSDAITISGERKTEEEKPGERYHFRQQNYGSFSVSYRLPNEVKPEDVKATYKSGVLEVTIPKAEETRARKVNIQAAD